MCEIVEWEINIVALGVTLLSSATRVEKTATKLRQTRGETGRL